MDSFETNFAKRYHYYKILWAFILGGFLGNALEILFYLITTRNFISRSSFLYGQFSVVWGLGFVIITVSLHNLIYKRDLLLFIVGAALGGIYEYVSSLVIEEILNVRFWDYSKIPFNLYGRINLQFCLFWGIVTVFWIKDIFPKLCLMLEKLPALFIKLFTWIFLFLFLTNSILTSFVLFRTTEQAKGLPPSNYFEELVDEYYPMEYVLERFSNMKFILPKSID